MTDNGTNGNGSTETKVSAVAALIKKHREAGGKPATGKAAKDLLDKFKTLAAAKQKADAAADEAAKAMAAHAEAMVLAFGDKKIQVGSSVYFPASRGETVFYREQGKNNPDDIIQA